MSKHGTEHASLCDGMDKFQERDETIQISV